MFAEDSFKFDKNGRKLSKRVENTVGKGEIAHYEQFLLFPQCFLNACFPEASKGVIVWEWVKIYIYPASSALYNQAPVAESITANLRSGPYSPTILKNIRLFLQNLVNLNITQFLIGLTVWFSQSEVMLHLNDAKYRKIWRTRLRMF